MEEDNWMDVGTGIDGLGPGWCCDEVWRPHVGRGTVLDGQLGLSSRERLADDNEDPL